jgi:hypothetical protein
MIGSSPGDGLLACCFTASETVLTPGKRHARTFEIDDEQRSGTRPPRMETSNEPRTRCDALGSVPALVQRRAGGTNRRSEIELMSLLVGLLESRELDLE